LASAAPLVSAVIPTYNYARYVAGAVESVLAQSFDDLEIVVVDDGSIDETADTLDPFAERIRYIRQEHRGLAAARNTGIRVARGPYVAFLDSDDLWLPEKVSVQIARLDGDPAVGLVYGEAALFTETSPGTATLHSYWAHHPSGKILPWLVRQNVVPSPTPMVRRELFDQVGSFDETLSACEDWDMWIRIAQVSEFAYVDRVLAKYRVHAANMSLDHERMMTNGLRVLEKAFSSPDLSPEIRRLRRSIISRRHADYALHCFYARQYAQARRSVIRAVTLDPRCLSYGKTAAVLSSCLFGSATATKLRAIKRAIAGRR
jgi:glycosyltransferase involved in cell wall biosynthesis